MSATGLEVFDKTVHVTNTWLDEIMDEVGPDRQLAWKTLGVVTRATRDLLMPELAAHLGVQLPLLVRGTYYEQYQPSHQPSQERSLDDFMKHVEQGLAGSRPVNPEVAVKSVFHVLSHYVEPGQIRKVRDALPADIRRMWPDPDVKH
ncbi:MULTISPECIES: DUF2267 domain-containing protein [Phyllobacteriaceae]|uniref:DUF2267 domain-containing protein n=1 Tax=Phyllobacterium phragmitis TaxID=2670329 RepID=A0ABQ0H608_9HYPH|nr:DUF2267 domain-containing protein [Mesorhizobium sp. RMAD-H1]MBB2972827.1 uncharacterized protein (DUF2267 family) [Mesorhizobium sp. RMAD-H1]